MHVIVLGVAIVVVTVASNLLFNPEVIQDQETPLLNEQHSTYVALSSEGAHQGGFHQWRADY